ncbi:protein phosphatase 1 regulatory subunit 15B [Neolamprologus brichardi]|uniref:protein phosphatase 1 regulatory subunit 15B n=1 Tax=Neolamprologus brichardi TaxID=32507 RepID=UPI001643A583|nr:protein phosphatase 1 regulatory subunit 15B [Neolamprologus brichardi]
MFRNMSEEGRLMGGGRPPSSSSMPGLDSQESSWIGLLSRPAMALVEKIRNRTLKSSLVTEESEFISPLEDVQLGPPQLSYLQCEPRGVGALPWLSADSLREIGLQNGAEVDLSLCQQTQFRYLSSFRAVLGHMLLSSQEVKPPGGQSLSSRPWWDSFWGGKECSEREPLSRGMLGENAGASDHKEQLVNNGSPPTVQNAVADRQLSIRDPQNCSGATIAAALPVTPEQDNGYSSLEEEHLSGVTSARAEPSSPQETEGMEEVVLAVPQCQNKTINFIMGGPCSEEEDSQSEESSSDDDDDDGFDSEGSSEMSDGTDDDDDDDEDDDSEAESEAERLWRSLCHSEDPYDPRNFTARLHTGVAAPRAIPVSTPPSSAQSSPSSSPPSSTDTWDDSPSASEADEESLRLWDSFSSSSDPFNPLNFQAPIRTRESATARAGKNSAYRRQESPPEYRKEEAEDRMDSGFCDLMAFSPSLFRQVRFCDDVEEFFASCGEEEEDRRGPWEELARDRCRFLRRCQEVEESIAYCLQPQHRRRVYEQLAAIGHAPQGVCLAARPSPAPL